MINLIAFFACIGLTVEYEPVFLLTLGGPLNNVIELTNEKEFILNGSWRVVYNSDIVGTFTSNNDVYLISEGERLAHTYESNGDFYDNLLDFTMVYDFYHVDSYDYGLEIETTFYMKNNVTFNGYFTFADVTLDGLRVRQGLEYQNSQGLISDYSAEIDQAYQEGLDNGYDLGYFDGVAEGKGVNNVIEWFGSIINSFTNFLGFEIAPGLSLGLIFGVPIFVGVLWFLLRALIN